MGEGHTAAFHRGLRDGLTLGLVLGGVLILTLATTIWCASLALRAAPVVSPAALKGSPP